MGPEFIAYRNISAMSSGTLYVRDSRTNVQYEIPIRRNAVAALDFKKIKAPGIGTDRADQVSGGLRVHDPGLQNTTVVETAISFSYESLCYLSNLTVLETMRETCFSSGATVWSSSGRVILKTSCICWSGRRIRQCSRGTT